MRSIALTCVAGPLQGQILRLAGGPAFLFGRYAKAHFSLAADPSASQLHFLIDISENRVRIVDIGSTNGLVINERHLGGKMGAPFEDFVTLKNGDTILAGACLFRLDIVENAAPAHEGKWDPPSGDNAVFVDDVPFDAPGGKFTTVIPADPGQAEKRREATKSTTKRVSELTDTEFDTVVPARTGSGMGALPQVDGFTLVGRIGGGGRGVVYKAIKNDSGAFAAVKMMLFNRNKSKKQRSLEMFRREIQITRQLDHPHLVHYMADGISQGLPYLALEYVDGGDLETLIRRSPDGRMDLPRAVPLFLQLLEAVGYLHGLSLVHRDIKPKNVLLGLRRGGGMSVKLSDMGMSCRSSSQDNDDFLPIVCEGGTPAYMPPEQLTDLTRALPQSDVFSAAATFYQMLTGSLLYDFTDKAHTDAIIEGRVKPILQLRPDLPAPVAKVVSKALSYSPESRFANAQELLDAFKAALA